MTAEEMDNMFETLYNNIGSNQAPGLNAYEKSIFLTKAQDEIIKNYFNPKSKGNNLQEGYDGNYKRQIDFSMLTVVKTLALASSVIGGNTGGTIPGGSEDLGGIKKDDSETAIQASSVPALNPFGNPNFDTRSNSKSVKMPDNIMMIVNESVEVTRDKVPGVLLQVVPIRFDVYSQLMSKPYKRPLKYQAWRLINSSSDNTENTCRADIVIGPSDTLTKYTIRYIKKPTPIIVSNLDGLKIDGFEVQKDCILDSSIHEEIVQRAVELAKAAWTSTGQDNIQVMMQAGQRSE